MIPSLFPKNYVEQYMNDHPNVTYPGQFVPEGEIFPPPHGDVDLIDCIDCYAEENEDECSEWEVAFTYPTSGQGFDQIENDKIVLVKANHYQNNQFFRIYSVEKRSEKSVLVKAQHISYDMNNIVVAPYKLNKNTDGKNPSRAITNLRDKAMYSTNGRKKFPFFVEMTTADMNTFATWETSKDAFEFDDPTSMRAALLDGEDSIQGTYGGDLVFNNFLVRLRPVGGANRNVTIEYGVDLIDMDQEDNISEMITTILPYYKRSTTDSQYNSEPIIYGDFVSGEGTYTVPRIEPVDLSEYFQSTPSKADITAKGRQWAKKEKIGEPEVTLTLSYATLGQDVRMFDQINVRFPELNVTTSAKVVRYRYNVLAERCEEIDVGHAKSSKLFNLMDASKLKKGLVPPERIKNESITNKKIAKGGVGKGKLGPQSVQTKNVEMGAINHDLLSKTDSNGEGGAVQSDVISNNAVTESTISKNAVTEEKINTDAVVENKIRASAVSWNKLKTGNGQPATKINSLETDMAYVYQLFASSARIDNIYAQHIYCSGSTIWVGGQAFSEETIVTQTGIWKALAHA